MQKVLIILYMAHETLMVSTRPSHTRCSCPPQEPATITASTQDSSELDCMTTTHVHMISQRRHQLCDSLNHFNASKAGAAHNICNTADWTACSG